MPQMANESTTQNAEPTGGAPPPPSPPTSPPGQPTGTQRPPPPVDGKTFYGYLYNKDKTPTALLDALLRAIGKHIETEIGDRTQNILNKAKLAAFYRAVGGDYDSLFVHAPDKSISYIWQALGVQHSLQPTDDDFAEPSVPALTLKGFVRWQSIQILLEPAEHVPFMQFAVRNWALRHPDTGVPFPTDLPSTAFPAVCDPQIDEWHRNCAKRLRSEAAPAAERPAPTAAAPDPRVHVHFNHVRPGGIPRHGPAMDYFERDRTRDVPFVHVSSRRAPSGQSPRKHRVNSSGSGSSMDERARRRRSFSDYPSPSHESMRSSAHLDPRRPVPTSGRRHSHPRPESESESGSDSEGPRSRGHRPVRPVASVRVFPPDAPRGHQGTHVPTKSHRSELRQDDSRRRSLPSGSFGIRQKITSLFPGSHDRTHSASRSDREADSRPTSSRVRPDVPGSRLSRRWSEESWSSDGSDSDVSPKHRVRRDPERMAQLLREREQRERELQQEEERERRSRKERTHLRPGIGRRTSSAADIERLPREWDARDRYRDRDRGRERRDSRDPRMNLTGDESERPGFRERERRRERDRDRAGSPVVTGVGGRKYPTDSLKPDWA